MSHLPHVDILVGAWDDELLRAYFLHSMSDMRLRATFRKVFLVSELKKLCEHFRIFCNMVNFIIVSFPQTHNYPLSSSTPRKNNTVMYVCKIIF